MPPPLESVLANDFRDWRHIFFGLFPVLNHGEPKEDKNEVDVCTFVILEAS